jgi:hypothetical protein
LTVSNGRFHTPQHGDGLPSRDAVRIALQRPQAFLPHPSHSHWNCARAIALAAGSAQNVHARCCSRSLARSDKARHTSALAAVAHPSPTASVTIDSRTVQPNAGVIMCNTTLSKRARLMRACKQPLVLAYDQSCMPSHYICLQPSPSLEVDGCATRCRLAACSAR